MGRLERKVTYHTKKRWSEDEVRIFEMNYAALGTHF